MGVKINDKKFYYHYGVVCLDCQILTFSIKHVDS